MEGHRCPRFRHETDGVQHSVAWNVDNERLFKLEDILMLKLLQEFDFLGHI
jgi:hypothetical protein